MTVSSSLTEAIIGSAIEVHRALGPGLLESTYEQCLCHEMNTRGLKVRSQVPVPLEYKGVRLACGYRLDVVVEDQVILELKCVESILPVHEAQVLSYLRLTGLPLALLINFHTDLLKNGIKRFVL